MDTKIGNLSQTIVKVPNFYLYQREKAIDTFRINQSRKLFKTQTLVNTMIDINVHNNYRYYYFPLKSERPPVIVNKDDKDLTNYSEHKPDKRYSNHIKKFNDYLNSASLGKIDSGDFKEGVRTNISNFVTKLNKTKKDMLYTNQLGNNGNDNRFLSKTFPKISLNPFDKRSVGNSSQLIRNRRIYDEDELFKQTLRDKLFSLRLVSDKVKDDISQRNWNIDCRRSYENKVNYVPSFKETIDNAFETMRKNDY